MEDRRHPMNMIATNLYSRRFALAQAARLPLFGGLFGACSLRGADEAARRQAVEQFAKGPKLKLSDGMKQVEANAIVMPDAEWKKILSSAEYSVLRHEGTEPPFSHPLNKNKKNGVYFCAGCGTALFRSAEKFDSGTGWPSFWRPIAKENVLEKSDRSLGMVRTEVRCRRCEGHLGHVFDDGPRPTGLRYCMNGTALRFEERAQ
jgi:peptide-methionine (R)-S-oxide reductase